VPEKVFGKEKGLGLLLSIDRSEDLVTQQINTDSPHGAEIYRMKGKIPHLKDVP